MARIADRLQQNMCRNAAAHRLPVPAACPVVCGVPSLDLSARFVYGQVRIGARPLGTSGALLHFSGGFPPLSPVRVMKIKNSLKSLKGRHRANRLVRRKGRVYIINKENPRYKARQG